MRRIMIKNGPVGDGNLRCRGAARGRRRRRSLAGAGAARFLLRRSRRRDAAAGRGGRAAAGADRRARFCRDRGGQRRCRRRAWFAQGVRLIWAFDEVEAIRAFQQAQRADPDCALCHLRRGLGARADDQPAAAHRRAGRRPRRHGARRRTGGRPERARPGADRGMALRTRAGASFSNAAYADFMERAARAHARRRHRSR